MIFLFNLYLNRMRVIHDTPRSVYDALDRLKGDKAKKSYVRELMESIGVCQSVKIKSMSLFDALFEIVKRHPDGDHKLKDVVDFYIKVNVRSGKGLALMIRKLDGTSMDVSWNTCATGKGHSPRQSFMRALRVCINDQIKDFRCHPSTNTGICALCLNTVDTYHVDHVIMFKTLVDEFIDTRPGFVYPCDSRYYELNDGTNQYRLCDEVLESAFQLFHKERALLRITCADCNLSRPM
jgi:hypothetical protein